MTQTGTWLACTVRALASTKDEDWDARDQSHGVRAGGELSEHSVAAIALVLGFVRTERVVVSFEQAGMLESEELRATETPEYMGRAVTSLAADSDVMSKSGGTYVAVSGGGQGKNKKELR